jgi:hypothetical protein
MSQITIQKKHLKYCYVNLTKDTFLLINQKQFKYIIYANS